MSDPILSCRGLEKSFGRTPALRGLDLEAAEGELIAITGPSGSGKTTLLQCLAGIQLPDEGEVRFRHERIDLMSARVRTLLRRREFGFIFQFAELIPELTAMENVCLPLLLEDIDRPEAMLRAGSWLARVGIPDLAERIPSELSGGERQRVAAARALVHEPSILFADEPAGALDSLSAEKLLELIIGIAEESHLTLLMVTHDPRVAAYGHREVVVRDGRSSTPVH
ncbi:MAG: ABC transporter ATP-binding protein [Acidimicrobiia bacterium]|jgi:putative ABC transport system ATP-binding protein